MINMERNELNKKIEKVLPPMRRLMEIKEKKRKQMLTKYFWENLGILKNI